MTGMRDIQERYDEWCTHAHADTGLKCVCVWGGGEMYINLRLSSHSNTHKGLPANDCIHCLLSRGLSIIR